MKFEVRNSVIRPAIATASTVIGRAMLPVLNNVRLDLGGGLLTITGSNIEQTVSTTIEVNGIESGSATVPAKKTARAPRIHSAGSDHPDGMR